MVVMSDALKSTSLSRFMRRFAPRIVRRFVRKDDGAAAVEFAMVAAPFIAIIFAIFETAIVFFAGQVLEVAMADSARLIMTGQAQKAGFNQAKFKEEVCNRVYGLVRLHRRNQGRCAHLHILFVGKHVEADRRQRQSYVHAHL